MMDFRLHLICLQCRPMHPIASTDTTAEMLGAGKNATEILLRDMLTIMIDAPYLCPHAHAAFLELTGFVPKHDDVKGCKASFYCERCREIRRCKSGISGSPIRCSDCHRGPVRGETGETRGRLHHKPQCSYFKGEVPPLEKCP